jgi:adenylate kinase
MKISLHDKHFEPYIEEEKILLRVKEIANQINQNHQNDFPLFVVILNGAFMFASDLIKNITINCEVNFMKVQSYQGLQSTNNIEEIFGINSNIENRTIILVEDIVDTGHTINYLHNYLNSKNCKQIKIATALLKPEAYNGEIKIDYVGFEIENKFVVGYGLDYNQQGRNLKHIYKLI